MEVENPSKSPTPNGDQLMQAYPPSIGRIVCIHGGRLQSETCGIVTRVIDNETVNVTAFPDNAAPEPFQNVGYRGAGKGTKHEWSWPPRK
jgi:hypothetical protein